MLLPTPSGVMKCRWARGAVYLHTTVDCSPRNGNGAVGTTFGRFLELENVTFADGPTRFANQNRRHSQYIFGSDHHSNNQQQIQPRPQITKL